jgi:hypothetical protein
VHSHCSARDLCGYYGLGKTLCFSCPCRSCMENFSHRYPAVVVTGPAKDSGRLPLVGSGSPDCYGDESFFPASWSWLVLSVGGDGFSVRLREREFGCDCDCWHRRGKIVARPVRQALHLVLCGLAIVTCFDVGTPPRSGQSPLSPGARLCWRWMWVRERCKQNTMPINPTWLHADDGETSWTL